MHNTAKAKPSVLSVCLSILHEHENPHALLAMFSVSFGDGYFQPLSNEFMKSFYSTHLGTK